MKVYEKNYNLCVCIEYAYEKYIKHKRKQNNKMWIKNSNHVLHWLIIISFM